MPRHIRPCPQPSMSVDKPRLPWTEPTVTAGLAEPAPNLTEQEKTLKEVKLKEVY